MLLEQDRRQLLPGLIALVKGRSGTVQPLPTSDRVVLGHARVCTVPQNSVNTWPSDPLPFSVFHIS